MTLADQALAAPYTVESIARDARARAGLGEDEPFDYLDSLEVLASSLDTEAFLNPVGRVAVRGALVASLVIQAQLRRAVAEHPEIGRDLGARPVFVIGLLRTGSTLVHNLLDQHPGIRCPNLWELVTPVGSRDPDEHERLADAAQAYVDDYYKVAPRLPMIHPLGARRPDECHRLLGNAFQSMVYWMRYRVPSYAEWLWDRDIAEAYRFHRLQLASIMWRLPGEVVVVKCPFHVWFLPSLAQVYPDARFVHLHRSPAATVPSTCSLSAEIRAARSDRVDRTEIGPFWLPHIERAVAEMAKARRTHLAGMPVLDVRYLDLMADTIGTMRRICEFVQVPMTEEAEAAMRRWLAENPADKHGTHRYTAEEFGLDSADLAGRFTEYREEFDL